MAQVGDHAAGHLVQILRVIVLALRADGVTFEFGDVVEVTFDRLDRFEIDKRLEADGAGVGRDVINRRLRRTVSQRRYRPVQRVDAELDRLEIVKRSETVVALAGKIWPHRADSLLNRLRQRAGPVTS